MVSRRAVPHQTADHTPAGEDGRAAAADHRGPPPLGRRLRVGDAGRSFTEVTATMPVGAPNPPDTVVDGGTLSGVLDVRAASVCGLAHRYEGRPRQDAYGIRTDRDGEWVVVVVADGVSQGSHSHEAADVVVRHGAREVADRLANTPAAELNWYELFTSLGRRILAAGHRVLAQHPSGVVISDADVAQEMSTTATFVVCQAHPAGSTREVAIAWLGDSPVWTVTPDGRWRCLSAMKTPVGGVSTSAVAALPYVPDSREGLPTRWETIGVADALLVMTDGVGDPLGDATGDVAAFLADAWREPPELLAFAEQVAFGKKGYDDDRTVVAIWPRTRSAT